MLEGGKWNTEDDMVKTILELLLKNNPNERISSIELLKGNYLPSKMEDEYVEEAIRNFSDSSSPYFSRLIESLFKQCDPIKDFAYDVLTSSGSWAADGSALLDQLRRTIIPVFELRGAAEFSPPLFHVKISDDSDSISFLDESGQIVILPGDLKTGYARYLARTVTNDSPASFISRRFAIDRIFRSKASGCQPKHIYEVDYDVALLSSSDDNDFFYETLEVLLVGIEVLTMALRVDPNRLSLVIGDVRITRIICDLYGIDKATFQFLTSNHSAALKRKHVLEKQKVDLGRIFASTSFDETCKRVIETCKNNPQINYIIQNLSQLHNYLLKRKQIHVVLDPFININVTVYNHSLSFQLQLNSVSDAALGDIVAIGGRYDNLVSAFKYPTTSKEYIGALGIVFSFTKLSLLLPKKPQSINVVTGDSSDLVHEIVWELWEAGIPAVTRSNSHESIPSGAWHEVIIEERKFRTHGLIKVVKMHISENRSFIDSSTTLSRAELVPYLLQTQQQHQQSQPSEEAPNVLFNFPSVKQLNRNILKERITRLLLPMTNLLGGSETSKKSPLQVLVHDLTDQGLSQLLVDSFSEKFATGTTAQEKEELVRLRDLLKQPPLKGLPLIVLYGLKKNRLDFLTN